MRPTFRHLLVTASMIGAMASFGPAFAQSSSPDPASAARANPFDAGLPVSAAILDTMRGGFETNAGLQVSFGIERSAYINGNLVTTTSLNVAESGQVTSVPSGTLVAGSSIALIQSGANNTFRTGPGTATNAAVIIQNSLDNQKIQGVTLITATVNSLALTKSANIQSSIQDALTGSLRR